MNETEFVIAGVSTAGIIAGLMVSIQNPVLGFLITGFSIAGAILASGIKVGRSISESSLVYDRFDDRDRNLAVAGFWVVVSFMPLFLAPLIEIISALGALTIVVFAFYILAVTPNLDESAYLGFARRMLLASVFALVYFRSVVLIIVPAAASANFIWQLIPNKYMEQAVERVGGDSV